jgi:hypothetical protein
MCACAVLGCAVLGTSFTDTLGTAIRLLLLWVRGSDFVRWLLVGWQASKRIAEDRSHARTWLNACMLSAASCL